MIVTSNSEDTNMQIVNSHHITEAAMYVDETGHISNRSHCNTMEKGIYTQVATSPNETKKGGETSKLKILRI